MQVAHILSRLFLVYLGLSSEAIFAFDTHNRKLAGSISNNSISTFNNDDVSQEQDQKLSDSFSSSASSNVPFDEPLFFGQYPTLSNAILSRDRRTQQNNQPDESPLSAAFYSVGNKASSTSTGTEPLVENPESIMLQNLSFDLAPLNDEKEKQMKQTSKLQEKSNNFHPRPNIISSLGARAIMAARGKNLQPNPNSNQSSYHQKRNSLNLSYLLPPAQAILSTKSSSSGDNRQSSKKPDSKLHSLTTAQLLELLQQLKSQRSEAETDSDDSDDEAELEPEEIEKLRRDKKLQRVLPTSHLFGGSVGVINESLLDNAQRGQHDDDSFTDDLGEDRDLDYILSGSKRKESEGAANNDDVINLNRFVEIGHLLHPTQDLLTGVDSPRSKRIEQRQPNRKVANPHPSPQELNNLIPIELLVDHLMSSSRLASFGVQHKMPQVHGDVENNGEEEDDDDDNDHDNNGTLPSEALMDSKESNIHETRIEFSRPDSKIFSSAANKNGSWVPLSSLDILEPKPVKSKIEEVRPSNKKKIKNKRHRRHQLNLVVGNRVLSRMDLIKLIRLLNRMASSREASSEREASRKLLRFLVKLALEEHRKVRYKSNKLQSVPLANSIETESPNNVLGKVSPKDDPIWDFFRSILASPENATGNSSSDAGSLELRPVSLPEKSASYKGMTEPESKASDSSQKRTSRSKIENLSDDLEQYFDSDFYEDLADLSNAKQNNTNSGLLESRQEPSGLARGPRRSRTKRPGYRLPVPIYGERELEAADEDDTELDHVRIKTKPGRLRRDRIKEGERRVGKEREPDDDQKTKDSGDPDADEREDEVDRDEEDPREKSSSKPTFHRAGNKEKSALVEDQEASAQQEPDSESGSSDEPSNEKPKQSLLEEHYQDGSNDDEDPDGDKEPEFMSNQTDSASTEHNREQNRESLSRTQRPRRRKRKRGRKEVDLDSRDEIPAPIVAGRFASQLRVDGGSDNSTQNLLVERPHRRTNSSSLFKPKVTRKNGKSPKIVKRDKYVSNKHDNTKKSRLNLKSVKESSLNKKKKSKLDSKPKRAKPTKMKKKNSRKKEILVEKDSPEKVATINGRKTRSNRDVKRLERKKILDPDEPHDDELSDSPDADYYNEGTSYSKICGDDGKCKVTVESSSPKLNKALNSGDKPTIEKHLGDWMSEPS